MNPIISNEPSIFKWYRNSLENRTAHQENGIENSEPLNSQEIIPAPPSPFETLRAQFGLLSPRKLIALSKRCIDKGRGLNEEQANSILKAAIEVLVKPTSNQKIKRNDHLYRSILLIDGACYLLTTVKKGDILIGEGSFKKVKYAIWLNPKDIFPLLAVGRTKKTNQDSSVLRAMQLNEIGFMKKTVGIPQLVQFVVSCENYKRIYTFMEYCSEGDLKSLITRLANREVKMSLGEKLQFIIEIFKGVKALHDRGIFHRDLKPANILIQRGGQPKIADLGLATLLSNDQQISQYCGTQNVMSPDFVLVHENSHKDPTLKYRRRSVQRMDSWALGLILKEMLAPNHYLLFQFKGNSFSKNSAMIDQFLQSRIDTSLDNLNGLIPPLFFELIRDLLRVDLKERLTCTKALERLENAQRSLRQSKSQKPESKRQSLN